MSGGAPGLGEVSAWDLLREVGAQEGLDVGRIVRETERNTVDRAKQRQSMSWDEVVTEETGWPRDRTSIDPRDWPDDVWPSGTDQPLAPKHSRAPDDYCTICEVRHAAWDALYARWDAEETPTGRR